MRRAFVGALLLFPGIVLAQSAPASQPAPASQATSAPASAPALPAKWRPRVFFGLVLGWAPAEIVHKEIPPGFHGGYPEDMILGWEVTRRFTICLELTQWLNDTFLGSPFHLHMFGPRAELSFGPKDIYFATASVGVALTDGDIAEKRAGLGVGATFGRHWPLNHWMSLETELGAKFHLYSDGNAFEPLFAVSLRFHGIIVPGPVSPPASPVAASY